MAGTIKVFCRVRPSAKVGGGQCLFHSEKVAFVAWSSLARLEIVGCSIFVQQPQTFLHLNHEHNQVEYDIPVELAPGIINNTKTR
jgi:hypothetical protein